MMDKTTVNLKSRSPKLFTNRFMEAATWSNPFIIAAIFLSVSGFSAYYSFVVFNTGLTEFFLIFICGFVSWTLAEYLIHRFVYHHLKRSKRIISVSIPARKMVINSAM